MQTALTNPSTSLPYSKWCLHEYLWSISKAREWSRLLRGSRLRETQRYTAVEGKTPSYSWDVQLWSSTKPTQRLVNSRSLPSAWNPLQNAFKGLEMAQRLRALSALPEDLGSIPNTHKASHNWTNCSSRRSDTLTPTYMQAKHQCTRNKNKLF